MKLTALSFALLFLLFSCGNKKEETETDTQLEELSMEELIERKVTTQLSIPANENYLLEIHKAQLTPDDTEDAIILLNRKDFAYATAKEKKLEKKKEELGYFGYHNFIFFYDGAKQTVTREITIPSDADIPLDIQFENLTSASHMDFTIDFRIRESRWRNFYTVRNNAPALLFQWNIQDLNEDGSLKTNHLSLEKGTYSLVKDIVVYDAEILSPHPSDLNTDFELSTKPKGEPKLRFFYYPEKKKYFTSKENI